VENLKGRIVAARDDRKRYFHLPYINIDLGTADAARDTTSSGPNQMASLCGEQFWAEEIRGLGERRIRLWVASDCE